MIALVALLQPAAVDVPTTVTQSPSIVYGLLAVAIGQFAVLVGQWLTARGARARERDLAKTNNDAAVLAAKITADGLAAAAKLVDDRATRDREWLMEDRKSLAADLAARNAELAAKVQATAESLAAKQVVDLANVAQLGRQHAAELALVVAHDQDALGHRGDRAVDTLSELIRANTDLTKEVGVKAEAAYQEANHVNNKISDLNEQLLKAQGAADKQNTVVTERATGQIEKIDQTTTRIEHKIEPTPQK